MSGSAFDRVGLGTSPGSMLYPGTDVKTILHLKITRRGLYAILVCTTILLLWSTRSIRFTTVHHKNGFRLAEPSPKPPPCRTLRGADEVLLIMRTSATELEDRFSVHTSTSLQCASQYLIFSDLEETYRGEVILDALESVSDEIRNNHSDFAIYRRLQEHGRGGLDPGELSGAPETFASMNGNTQKPAWKLDKWKFMPMVNRTLYEYPDMKWYVFMEADTFLVWSTLLQWLSMWDPAESHYQGSMACLGNHSFAHGGSGFLMSRPAMVRVTEHYSAHKAEIEKYTDQEWAGDYVLGQQLEAVGIHVQSAIPHFQGDYPGVMPYSDSDERAQLGMRAWCFPTISYHKMSSDMIRSLWDFEQQWISTHGNSSESLTHGDVFRAYVLPQMMADKADWDNLSDKAQPDVRSLDDCRARCEVDSTCKQYSFLEATGQCNTRSNPRLGKLAQGVYSGWITDRVTDLARNAAPCGDEGWQVGEKRQKLVCNG